jgi:restriction endonuclease S subunit
MSKSINQANIGGSTLAKYKIPVPPMLVQNKLAEKLEKLEAEIAAANKIIAEAPARKSAILDKYLK